MPQVVDKRLVRDRFRRRLQSYSRHAQVQDAMARRLLGRLGELKGLRFPRLLEIGCGAGVLTRLILQTLDVDKFYVNDLVEECATVVEDATRSVGFDASEFIAGDIEGDIRLPSRLDLIVSNATFQWLEDLDSILSRLTGLLTTNGVLAFSVFGPRNLAEIRELTGAGLSYSSAIAIADLLRRDLRILHQWEDTTVLRFASPVAVLKHLRDTGVNALRQEHWRRSALDAFSSAYRERFRDGDSVSLTYHPMVFIAEKL
jgi:malonyl-CoA O-methyltransferase